MICKNCGKEYSVCDKIMKTFEAQCKETNSYNWRKIFCSPECYANTYKDEFKKLGYSDDFSNTLANLATNYSDGVVVGIDLSSATENLIDKINAIPEQYLVPVGDIPVYCSNCKHFRLDDESIPYCPYEEKECDIRDCEDSRPFRERPMYEEGG
jgi:hypothetical protein